MVTTTGATLFGIDNNFCFTFCTNSSQVRFTSSFGINSPDAFILSISASSAFALSNLFLFFNTSSAVNSPPTFAFR